MVDPDMDAPRLVGRASELAVLDDFVRGSVSGGGALLLTGDPGVGKSALLDAAVRAAAAHGTRVIRGGGVEYEADVGFAVLHQLLGPLGDHVEELPASRRSALEVALGLASGPAPDRLSVLDAALATFRRAAAATPLLVVVDDMHWLDQATASVIGFVGRRLADSRVGLLGAARTGAGGFAGGAGWRELVVPALGHEASLDLLGARFAHLPARVRRDVVEEAQGNPLALLEFGAAEGSRLTPGAQCAAAVATGAGRAVRRLYDERVARLPADTRLLLLLAALEGSGNLAVLASAGGPGLQALGPRSGTTSSSSTSGSGSCSSGTRWSRPWWWRSRRTTSGARPTHVWPRCSPDRSSDGGSTWRRRPWSRRRRWPRPSRPARTRPCDAATSSEA